MKERTRKRIRDASETVKDQTKRAQGSVDETQHRARDMGKRWQLNDRWRSTRRSVISGMDRLAERVTNRNAIVSLQAELEEVRGKLTSSEKDVSKEKRAREKAEADLGKVRKELEEARAKTQESGGGKAS